jgi:molybdenum cofactor cytidylyltransferase
VIAALVLAAGGSSRLGRPKQLEPWGAGNLLDFVMAEVAAGPFDHRFVVLGSLFEEVLESIETDGWVVVENPEWEEGVASSLRVGLDAVLRLTRSDAAAIFLGDQPGIEPDVVRRLLSARGATKRPAIVPKYRYSLGNPVVVEKILWHRLMSLEGDEGAKRLLQAHPEWVEEVWFGQSPPRDVDTNTDVSELRPKA